MENTTYQIIDIHTGKAVSKVYSYAQRNIARRKADKMDLQYGAHRFTAKPTFNQ